MPCHVAAPMRCAARCRRNIPSTDRSAAALRCQIASRDATCDLLRSACMHSTAALMGADSDSCRWSVLLGCVLGMRPLLDLGRTQGQRAACVGHPVANGSCGRGMAPARHGPAWHWHGTGTGPAWHWPVRHGTGMALALAWNGTGPAWHGAGIGPAWHWPGMALARHGMQSAARASVLSSSESLQSITAHSLNGSSHSSLRRSCGHTGTVPQSTRRVLTRSTPSTPCIDCATAAGRAKCCIGSTACARQTSALPSTSTRPAATSPLHARGGHSIPLAKGATELAFAHAAAFGMPRCWDAMPRWSSCFGATGASCPS